MCIFSSLISRCISTLKFEFRKEIRQKWCTKLLSDVNISEQCVGRLVIGLYGQSVPKLV
ncbi:hypothetical protein MKW98_005188, partial [Papaver atlanticum]